MPEGGFADQRAGMGYYRGMERLFNKTFFRFAVGFAGVLMLSFALAVALSHISMNAETSSEESNS